MDTDDLILALSNGVKPVMPLPDPRLRVAAWTVLGAVYLVVLTMVMSPRSDAAARLNDPSFVIEQIAALVTALTAAFAALTTIIPGRDRRVVWLPVVSGAAWLAIVAFAAIRDSRVAPAAVPLVQADWACVWTILLGSVVPAAVMARMLRRGAALAPHLTAALGGFAAAGFGNVGICLFHSHTSYVTVLLWHGGTVLAIALLTGLARHGHPALAAASPGCSIALRRCLPGRNRERR